MSHDEDTQKGGQSQAPFALSQNPSPNPIRGQSSQTVKESLVREIMGTFRSVLPSNYVSQVNGPWYSLQFQAMCEQLAEIQISATEVYKDSGYDFTRTDFLWQVLGTLVFPGATNKSGIPQIDGDTAYREFLHKMVLLLLDGATRGSMESGLEALDPSIVATVLERYLSTPPRDPEGSYTIDDQFITDILVEGFPVEPFVLKRNAEIVLSALKPAHVLYGYSYLFRDAFDEVASDEGGLSFDLGSYYYADLRKWCLGAQRISGVAGVTQTNRSWFTDFGVSFSSVRPGLGCVLTVESGVNAGRYRVTGTRALLRGADATPRPYTLSTGGTGTVTALSDDTVEDAGQDWGSLAVDTTITIASGPNAGTYRLDTVLGSTGGPLGTVGVSGTRVRVSAGTLELSRRMPSDGITGQAYTVTVDRLGVQVPRPISGEDVSLQFVL